MIYKTPYLFLQRLLVIKNQSIVYDEVFHQGINIIRGQNSSGKSTITDFIYFVLGADLHNWKPEADECDVVIAQIDLNGEIITVKRYITDKSMQPSYLFWGIYEDSESANETQWKIYPFRRSGNKISFSQLIFKALQIPDIISDTENNLTIHQLFRLIYNDQLSPPDSLIKPENFDSPLIRESIGEILLGYFDNSIYDDEKLLRDKKKEIGILKGDYKNLTKIFKESEIIIDRDELEDKIKKKLVDLENVNKKINEIEQEDRKNQDDKYIKESEIIKNEISKITHSIYQTNSEIDKLNYDITDSIDFINNLKNRIESLNESISIRETLGELPIHYCPNCLSKLSETEENKCVLCHEEYDIKNKLNQPIRMLNELELQVNESDDLLIKKKLNFDELQTQKRQLIIRYKDKQKKYDTMEKSIKSSRDNILDNLLIKKGYIESECKSLTQQRILIERIKKIEDGINTITGEIGNLERKIAMKRGEQENKKQKALNKIYQYTILLLRNDLSREETFKTGTDIQFDLSKNTYSFEGRNHFSASSDVYLKNSIHFSFFFASLTLDFIRYPRFILCDNIEDKGMEEARSQNFQQLLTDLSEKSTVAHQIIFTTSMIKDELNIEKFCIGDFYTNENKSLQV